jgi:hypothetical protein
MYYLLYHRLKEQEVLLESMVKVESKRNLLKRKKQSK